MLDPDRDRPPWVAGDARDLVADAEPIGGIELDLCPLERDIAGPGNKAAARAGVALDRGVAGEEWVRVVSGHVTILPHGAPPLNRCPPTLIGREAAPCTDGGQQTGRTAIPVA